MSPEDFRQHGHALVDWLADYMAGLDARPVLSTVEPGSVRAALPAHPPTQGEPFAAMLADVDRAILPGITHWQHPGWFAFFPANATGPSILGELLAAGLGAQGMLWATSPALTEVESLVMDWLVELLGLPGTWRMDTGPGGGVIQTTASEATHLALVVARHRAVKAGARAEQLVVYRSSQAHSSVEKGGSVAGFAHQRVVGTDDSLALDPAALAEAVREDLSRGLVPCAVVSTIGTTNTGACDPLPAVADLAEQYGLWHHVDAAWAGAAMVLPENRGLQAGLERVDSYVFNPHKWLFVNFDCSAFYVADRAELTEAMSILPPYLRNRASDSGAVVDYRDWQVPLGRRFRALKLLFTLRHYGQEGLQQAIGEHIALTRWLTEHLVAHPRLTLVAPRSLALVCFAHVDGDEATDALAERVNASGHSAITASTLPDGRRFLRVAIGQANTRREHVERLWSLLSDA